MNIQNKSHFSLKLSKIRFITAVKFVKNLDSFQTNSFQKIFSIELGITTILGQIYQKPNCPTRWLPW